MLSKCRERKWDCDMRKGVLEGKEKVRKRKSGKKGKTSRKRDSKEHERYVKKGTHSSRKHPRLDILKLRLIPSQSQDEPRRIVEED